MSEVVRARLEALLAEVEPRRFEGSPYPESTPYSAAAADEPATSGQRLPRRAVAAGSPAAELRSRLVEFGREHLAAVVVVLLVGCAWTAYTLLQARSTPVAVAAVPAVVASPSPTPTPEPQLLVHVLGAVRKPGLVELAPGSRVADAIEAAGGLTAKADPGELNLAAMVADGDQLVIGTSAEPGGEVRGSASGSGGASGSGKVSLNTATLEQLDTLPGVGPVTAQKILDWREAHGKFSAVAELQEVDGIGPKTFADIEPHVRI